MPEKNMSVIGCSSCSLAIAPMPPLAARAGAVHRVAITMLDRFFAFAAKAALKKSPKKAGRARKAWKK
jgi:hypothetical protein